MGKTEKSDVGGSYIQQEMLRPWIQEIIREEIKKTARFEQNTDKTEEKALEMDLTEEEPLRMDQVLIQNVTDAISAFRKQ